MANIQIEKQHLTHSKPFKATRKFNLKKLKRNHKKGMTIYALDSAQIFKQYD